MHRRGEMRRLHPPAYAASMADSARRFTSHTDTGGATIIDDKKHTHTHPRRVGGITMLASASFGTAVESLRAARPRPEILLEEIPAPQRLAPYSFALGASVLRGDAEMATGRLVLLFNPAGEQAWNSTMRLVSYLSAEVEPDLAADPSLARLCWSWLADALAVNEAPYRRLAGAVTQICSTRFDDEPGSDELGRQTTDVELRASWSPHDAVVGDLSSHVDAWCDALAASAGLPPPGVTVLRPR